MKYFHLENLCMRKAVVLIFSIWIMGGACQYLNNKAGLEQDNLIEQCVEAAIKAETGLDIDLTP